MMRVPLLWLKTPTLILAQLPLTVHVEAPQSTRAFRKSASPKILIVLLLIELLNVFAVEVSLKFELTYKSYPLNVSVLAVPV